ncbi:unnamed protein product, partial [Leptidea sinapis]
MLNSEYTIHAPDNPTLVHYCPNLSPSIPDILLSKNFHSPSNIKTIPALSSNHFPVFMNFETKLIRNPIQKFNYAKADWKNYRSFLNSATLLNSKIYDCPQEIDIAITNFQHLLLEARDRCVPLSILKPWNCCSLPRHIMRKIKIKNRLRKYAANETNPLVKKVLFHKIKELKIVINNAVKLNNDKRLVKSLRPTSFEIPTLKLDDGSLITNQQSQCDVLANAFLNNLLLTNDWQSDEQSAIERSIASLKD